MDYIGVSGFELLLDVALKGLIILMITGGVVLLMRRGSAAKRHLVWMLGLGSLICLPILSVLGPVWQVPVLPAEEVGVEVAELNEFSTGEYSEGAIGLFDFESREFI
ncbi:MAG: hypothetical protein GY869_20525, partial [Planctomycetes bacterium]|nr:hypothetical protein [Planctomycetota bacterium]